MKTDKENDSEKTSGDFWESTLFERKNSRWVRPFSLFLLIYLLYFEGSVRAPDRSDKKNNRAFDSNYHASCSICRHYQSAPPARSIQAHTSFRTNRGSLLNGVFFVTTDTTPSCKGILLVSYWTGSEVALGNLPFFVSIDNRLTWIARRSTKGKTFKKSLEIVLWVW